MAGGAIILAAGNSTRFGSDKRQYRFADGRTLLEVTLTTYQAVFDRLFVVLKPGDRPLAQQLANVEPVFARDAALGMGHSLAAGVAAARHLDYLFVALADMPHVQTQSLHQLRREFTTKDCIVQPEYQGAPGHPVGFGNAYFSELRALTGDVGAKALLANQAGNIRRVPVNDPGIIQDIDRPPTTTTPTKEDDE